jgi:hypothetical protein
MRKILTAAIGLTLLATPAFAGWDDPPYGCSAPGACRLEGPGAYGGYGYIPPWAVNGNGYRPPPPAVPVEPAYCHRPIFDSRMGKWRCAPVMVPRVQ